MNTGRPESGYGYWFPGKENDGASGWQFMTAKWGRAWIRKEVPRGAWPYDGEIDLGYGAGLRMASVVLTNDPVFDWIAYGGSLTLEKDSLAVVPRDGLRQRFDAVLENPQSRAESALTDGARPPLRKIRIELDRDGFTADRAIVTDRSLRKIVFTLENRTGDVHRTGLRLSVPGNAVPAVFQDGKRVAVKPTGNGDYPYIADLRVGPAPTKIEISAAK
jgi:hypothetical protein